MRLFGIWLLIVWLPGCKFGMGGDDVEDVIIPVNPFGRPKVQPQAEPQPEAETSKKKKKKKAPCDCGGTPSDKA